MKTTLSSDAVNRIINTRHHDPFTVLGAHVVDIKGKRAVAVRAFLPEAKKVSVIFTAETGEYEMTKVMEEGFFEVLLPDHSEIIPYNLKEVAKDNTVKIFNDPYSFLPTLTPCAFGAQTENCTPLTPFISIACDPNLS